MVKHIAKGKATVNKKRKKKRLGKKENHERQKMRQKIVSGLTRNDVRLLADKFLGFDVPELPDTEETAIAMEMFSAVFEEQFPLIYRFVRDVNSKDPSKLAKLIVEAKRKERA